MSTQPPKWHFFMHSTYKENVLPILKNEQINPSNINNYSHITKYKKSEHKYFNRVFCRYVFDEIPKIKKMKWKWLESNDEIIFVIDPSIAKDRNMIVCDYVNYGCKPTEKDCLMHTSGNLERIPSMQKLKKHIINHINSAFSIKPSNKKNMSIEEENLFNLQPYAYSWGHEVLFDTVPISYIRAILISNNEKKGEYIHPIKEYIKQNNLPIKLIFYPTTTNYYFQTLFEKI